MDEDLEGLSREQLIAEAKTLRTGIRTVDRVACDAGRKSGRHSGCTTVPRGDMTKKANQRVLVTIGSDTRSVRRVDNRQRAESGEVSRPQVACRAIR